MIKSLKINNLLSLCLFDIVLAVGWPCKPFATFPEWAPRIFKSGTKHRELIMRLKDISQKRLKKLLHYDPESGVWTWIHHTSNRVHIGDRAGRIGKDLYRYIGVDGVIYRSCRLAFLYMDGYFPENEAEHRNRIKDDDGWENLREATHMCNMRNVGLRVTNTSGVTGVSWDKGRGKWQAYIKVNYKNRNLGYHDELTEAVLCRLAAEQCLDWKNCDSSSPAYEYVQRIMKQ
jgi:hypothetical protein